MTPPTPATTTPETRPTPAETEAQQADRVGKALREFFNDPENQNRQASWSGLTRFDAHALDRVIESAKKAEGCFIVKLALSVMTRRAILGRGPGYIARRILRPVFVPPAGARRGDRRHQIFVSRQSPLVRGDLDGRERGSQLTGRAVA